MNAILCETGIAFNINEYISTYGNLMFIKLQKKYIIRTVDRITKTPRITKLFKIVNCGTFKIIEFPRFAHKQLCNGTIGPMSPIKNIDYQLPKHNRIEHINYIGKSNPNQKIIVDHIIAQFKSDTQVCGVTLKVAPGLGKSFIAKDIIDKMKLKTLIVVPNTYLLDQWVSLLTQYFPETTIGTMYGKHKSDGDIIVGIINTVSELKEFEMIKKIPIQSTNNRKKFLKEKHTIVLDDILKTVGLTIFDESHLYVSKEFRKVFHRIWSRYTIGLSATPDIREDKLDVIHRSWLGPILDAETLDGFNAVQDKFTSEVNIINYHALNDNCKFNLRDDNVIDYSSIIESIVNDPNRNEIIIQQIINLMNNGLYTFVFSDRRSHLEHLYNLLEEALTDTDAILEMPESNKKIILYGGSNEQTIMDAKKVSTVIFTTYSYSSTGVSITKMNGLILATPRRSGLEQITGRIFRLGSDTNIKRVIVDISDAKLPLKSQIRERMNVYKKRECTINKTTMMATECS